MQLVNLRRHSTKKVLDAAGVKRAPDEFGCRAVSRIRSLVDGGELHTRLWKLILVSEIVFLSGFGEGLTYFQSEFAENGLELMA